MYAGKQFRVGLRPDREKPGLVVRFCQPMPRPDERITSRQTMRAYKAWSRSLDRRAGHA